jgi:hypothetical protein
MTHWYKDVERTSVGRNRQSPPAVSGTLDVAKRAAKIAELRELMEEVERRWQAPERSKSRRRPRAANVVTRHVTAGMTGQVVAHKMCVTL